MVRLVFVFLWPYLQFILQGPNCIINDLWVTKHSSFLPILNSLVLSTEITSPAAALNPAFHSLKGKLAIWAHLAINIKISGNEETLQKIPKEKASEHFMTICLGRGLLGCFAFHLPYPFLWLRPLSVVGTHLFCFREESCFCHLISPLVDFLLLFAWLSFDTNPLCY